MKNFMVLHIQLVVIVLHLLNLILVAPSMDQNVIVKKNSLSVIVLFGLNR